MATVLKDGINYSWGDIKLVLFGRVVTGITSISYKKMQSKENNYGQGELPISRGYGNVEFEASIELYVDEWRKIKASALAVGSDPLSLPKFDIQVLYGNSRTQRLGTDIVQRAEFLEDPMEGNQGDTKMLVTIPLIIAGIEAVEI
jgi:hypothetical protein